MDATPPTETLPQQLVPLSDVEIRKLRALPYPEYLQTPWWQRRRDRAIRLAQGCCNRCDERDDLWVHHRTYANVGAERDEDLEVVCRGATKGTISTRVERATSASTSSSSPKS